MGPIHYGRVTEWLHYIRNASAGSIFAKGLGLGVAVEGILECEFSEIGKPSSMHVNAVEEMITLVNSFTGNNNVQDRTSGALREMKKARAKDKLLELQKEGVMRKEDMKAWDSIRNKGAHARPPEREERQEWIDNCFKTEVLINHLIFYAIGYQGEFTDYGTRHWPQSRYSCARMSSA